MILDYLETHVVDHCNLRCSGCGHFSPLANASFAEPAKVQQDFERLAQLFDDISTIRLLGGEPLLHPGVITLFECVRSAFPRSRISIVTNGVLLARQPAQFWERCHANDILIQVTRYPIRQSLQKSEEMAHRFEVELETSDVVSVFHRFLNIQNNSDPQVSFRQCRSVFKCPFLKDGHIFLCPLPGNIHIFNSHFHTQTTTTSDDSISIFGDITGSDILDFLDRPSPFCRSCLSDWPAFDWSSGKLAMEEWTGSLNQIDVRSVKK